MAQEIGAGDKVVTKAGESQNSAEMAKEKEESVPLVLEPDHPMMQRFQKALKSHLERLKSRLTEDVLELDSTLKMKEKEKETTGVELYTLQQELYRQQTALGKCEETIEGIVKERENVDESIKNKKIRWKEEIDRLNNAKKKEHEMVTELHKLSSLEKQIEKWESEMDANLAVSQRISEKTQADKNKLIEEKRKMDMHMLRLMTEVTKFESEIKFMDAELDIKWEEKTIMHQTLSDANADLQSLIDEQKRLVAAWNSVVATMTQRDAVYSTVSKELGVCHEAFKTLNAEIESYKKSAAEAMKKNEQLSVVYGRIVTEKETAEASVKGLLDKKDQLERKIALLAASLAEIEAEVDRVKADVNQAENELLAKGTECNKINVDRQSIEDKILLLLQDQMANDKTALHLNKLVRDLRERARQLELAMVEKENRISKRYLEVEELKGIVARNNEVISELNKELERRELELKTTEDDIAKCHVAMVQKQGSYAVLLKKIEKQMEKTGTLKPGQDPLQLRVTELEKMNAELQEKNDKMQSFWLLQQNNNVKLTHQRHEQLKEINLLRKQVAILEQKTLKMELEIEKESQIECEVNKSIASLQSRMLYLNKKLTGKKDYSDYLNKENSLIQSNFLQTLKESELEQIRLKAEIADLETSLEELAETMLETQKEMLTWERRIKMALETKENIHKEKSGSGEIGQMKTEIHRMEIRYDQLRKAQEKLISDLELCVLRRDSISEAADAKEKRQAQGFSTRYMMQKKLDNIKNRIRCLQNDRNNIDKAITRTRSGQEDLQNTIKKKSEKLKEMEEKTRKLDRQIEDGKLNKQQNLEMLIRRQKKSKQYNQVKMGKHRLLHKSEIAIDNDMQTERTLNAALASISESLLKDFPAHRFSLMKILNTIRAKPS